MKPIKDIQISDERAGFLALALTGMAVVGVIAFVHGVAARQPFAQPQAPSPCPHVIFSVPREELQGRLEQYATFANIEVVFEGDKAGYTLVVTPVNCLGQNE